MIVSDSSPLIALSRIGAFYLLRTLYTSIVIAPAVHGEVVTKGKGRPGDAEVRQGILDEWIRVQAPTRTIDLPHQAMNAAEVEAISLALELSASLLMDEIAARKRAAIEGVHCVGTFDLLRLAKHEGHIRELKPHLDALAAAGFYIHPDLYRQVLHAAKELDVSDNA